MKTYFYKAADAKSALKYIVSVIFGFTLKVTIFHHESLIIKQQTKWQVLIKSWVR